MERTDAEKHASYINMVEAISLLSRGSEVTDEWIRHQIRELKWLREFYPDMSFMNMERKDYAFRAKAVQSENLLQQLILEINIFGTLDLEIYLELCKTIMSILDDLTDEDEDLADAITKMSM